MVKKTNLCHKLSKVSSKKFSWKNFSVEIGFRPFVYLLLPMMMNFFFNEKYYILEKHGAQIPEI